MKLINDKYKKARGGYSRLLAISCRKCGAVVCSYQKDGPGALRRMYIDRISAPMISVEGNTLNCPNGHDLGTKIIFAKENRPAFRLYVDAITKRILKA